MFELPPFEEPGDQRRSVNADLELLWPVVERNNMPARHTFSRLYGVEEWMTFGPYVRMQWSAVTKSRSTSEPHVKYVAVARLEIELQWLACQYMYTSYLAFFCKGYRRYIQLGVQVRNTCDRQDQVKPIWSSPRQQNSAWSPQTLT